VIIGGEYATVIWDPSDNGHSYISCASGLVNSSGLPCVTSAHLYLLECYHEHERKAFLCSEHVWEYTWYCRICSINNPAHDCVLEPMAVEEYSADGTLEDEYLL